MEDIKKVMADVRAKMGELGLTEAESAKSIGVTSATLARHLGGAYVRSDSLAKYRRWCAGAVVNAVAPPASARAGMEGQRHRMSPKQPIDPLGAPSTKPAEPLRVVDLFGGCGGLSLGFELAAGRELFRTVLAIDIEDAMVRVFNANHEQRNAGCEIGRQADLSEFLNEAEVLAFYLEHLSRSEQDSKLDRKLESVKPIGLRSFLRRIHSIDASFVSEITKARGGRAFLDALAKVERSALSQTSVLGFHNALKLPQPGAGRPSFRPPLWGELDSVGIANSQVDIKLPASLLRECEADAKTLWKQEITKLRERVIGSGSGQLASAAAKINQSLSLVDSDAYEPIRSAWIAWRALRDGTRRLMFEDEGVLEQLRRIYKDGHEVHVLLGGPPCQGFSRIGRGKIRSLREQSVHVQSDAKAGDKRNELMLQYVLFVAALAPATFLFENVRHFQAEVKTPDGTFNATDILAEAISDISHDGLKYGVASRIVLASDHLVPQTRERFFMVGVRDDIAGPSDAANAAS